MSNNDPMLGRKLKGYQIVEALGYGGMGVVYRAEHPLIGKKVAIKVLQKNYSRDPSLLSRFFLEAKTVNDIHHDNVIDILDLDQTEQGDYFLIMEYLEGQTLSDSIETEAPFTTRRVGHIGLQICSALDAAHDKGIIHRDLKGENVFLIERAGQDDFVKVLDFGIAKLLYSESNALKTKTGAIIGTPLCMSPEQATGAPIDEQTDVYALGVMMFQMAAKVPPFYDPNPFLMVAMHITHPAPPLRQKNPKADARLEPVIARCLEKEKGKRYRSMREVAYDLSRACGLDFDPYFKKKAGTRSNPLIQVESTSAPTPVLESPRPEALLPKISPSMKATTPLPSKPLPETPTRNERPSAPPPPPRVASAPKLPALPPKASVSDEVTTQKPLPVEEPPNAAPVEVVNPAEDNGPTQPLNRESLFALLGQKPPNSSSTMPEVPLRTVKISGYTPLEETPPSPPPVPTKEPTNKVVVEQAPAPKEEKQAPAPPSNWGDLAPAKQQNTAETSIVEPGLPAPRIGLVFWLTFLGVGTLGILLVVWLLR